jgi:preprotein translocase subunit SecF
LFDFVTRRKWFFLTSGLVILIGVVSLIVSGLNLGIEFSSGSTMTLVFEEPVGRESLRNELANLAHPEAIIQHSPKDAFLVDGLSLDTSQREQLAEDLQNRYDTTIRVTMFAAEGNATASGGNGTLVLLFGGKIDQGDLDGTLGDLGYSGFSLKFTTLDSYLVRTETLFTEEEDQIKESLEGQFGPLATLDVYSISAVVATERVGYTLIAIGVAALGILGYITWAFRKLVRPISYGVGAIIALMHDALIVLGIFSLFQIEVNSMFIIAILTVIGYSVNNTIVIFDRIRENRSRDVTAGFDSIVNASLTETLGRSLNTSLTTLCVLLCLLLFGGPTISNFVLALTIGVVVGTYSSLFIAGQFVVSWEHGELGRLFRWARPRRREG